MNRDSRQTADDLGPLRSGQRVIVMGGGPAGTSCALALKRWAAELGREIDVVLYEPKDFRREGNVCVGVLSSPFQSLFQDLGLTLPPGIVQRRIVEYVIHTDHQSLRLPEPAEADEATLALDRRDLDAFMLDSARAAGVDVHQEAVVDLRFETGAVLVVGAQGTRVSGDVVVGAFGLSGDGLRTLEARTPYRRPGLTRSVLVDLPMPRAEIDERIGDSIHALLLAKRPNVEFAALTPKNDHVTVNVAGVAITGPDLEAALATFQALGLLQHDLAPARRLYNVFPAGPARHIYGDRVVTIGNTSGLLRPLKGKGINAGLLTGMRAARAMLHVGISRQAFASYHEACDDITSDYRYGLLLRSLYHLTRRLEYLDPVVGLAHRDQVLNRCLHSIVSGEGAYRDVVMSLLRPGLWWRLAGTLARYELGRRTRAGTVGEAPSLPPT